MVQIGMSLDKMVGMVTPIITALGHAGLRIDAPGVRLLADPWLSMFGAFLGSWFPFPDNSHLRSMTEDIDLVVVSHEHLDHLDLDLMNDLPADVPIVVPRYPSTILERRLAAAGRRHVVSLDAWERYSLGGSDWLTVIPEQCPMSHDAAVLFHVGGKSILHSNDARLSLGQLHRAAVECGGTLDVMYVQMSGASWHPLCYDYEDSEIQRIVTRKRIGKFTATSRLARQVQPGLILPYAGPPCFLDEQLFEFNPRLHGPDIFPDQEEAVAWLRERLPDQASDYQLPGDILDLADNRVHRDPHWSDFSLSASASDRRAYLEDYARRRAPYLRDVWLQNPPADDGLAERFKTHFEELGELSEYFLARIGFTVRFEVLGPGGGVWDVHLGPERVRVDLDGGQGPANYLLRLDSRWLASVVDGRTRWEELLLSLRFTARREPDRYNDYFVGLLKHADRSALRALEEYESSRDSAATFEVVHEGGTRRISRFCPHAGEDLSMTAMVEGGVIRCLGHNYEFDLSTGECLNAHCEPIAVSVPAQGPA